MSYAEHAETYAREGAFLDLVPPPCPGLPDRMLDADGRAFGPPLAKLTPWRHHLLLGYDSPYARPGLPANRTHLLQALWLCSPRLVLGSRLRFACFRARWFWFSIRRCRQASAALNAWLDAPFKLVPPRAVSHGDGQGAAPTPDTPWLALVVQLGRKLGLGEREVLHLPYARLWAYLDALEGASTRDRPGFNRARDRQIREYLKRRRAAANAS